MTCPENDHSYARLNDSQVFCSKCTDVVTLNQSAKEQWNDVSRKFSSAIADAHWTAHAPNTGTLTPRYITWNEVTDSIEES